MELLPTAMFSECSEEAARRNLFLSADCFDVLDGGEQNWDKGGWIFQLFHVEANVAGTLLDIKTEQTGAS